jgi:hypothetical protein
MKSMRFYPKYFITPKITLTLENYRKKGNYPKSGNTGHQPAADIKPALPILPTEISLLPE